MKKTFLFATVCALLAVGSVSAQMASLTFDDHNGTANAGDYTAGQSFSFDITLHMSGQMASHTTSGLSYWLATTAGDSFFRITLNDISASSFSDHTQNINPASEFVRATGNAHDLGGTDPNLDGDDGPDDIPGEGEAPNGNYFIGHITIQIDGSIAPGMYTIFTTDSAFTDKTSEGTDFVPGQGMGGATDVNIPRIAYTINIIPEPSTLALIGVTAVASAAIARRRRAVR